MLTETWTNEYSDLSFAGFKFFWLSRLEKMVNPNAVQVVYLGINFISLTCYIKKIVIIFCG